MIGAAWYQVHGEHRSGGVGNLRQTPLHLEDCVAEELRSSMGWQSNSDCMAGTGGSGLGSKGNNSSVESNMAVKWITCSDSHDQ